MAGKKAIIADIINGLFKAKDTAYHGSPFLFERFDATKIGSCEGMAKKGKGIYLFRTKRIAPYYANLKSPDAPLHFGKSPKVENPKPTVYTVTGLNSLNLQKVNGLEAKAIKKNQALFQSQHPNVDGVELETGEICIFPHAVDRLQIASRQPVDDFVRANKGYDFRTWTTDPTRLARLGY